MSPFRLTYVDPTSPESSEVRLTLNDGTKFVYGKSIYNDEEVPTSFGKLNDKFNPTNMFEQIRSLKTIKDSYEDKLESIAKKWPKIISLCEMPRISHIRASIISNGFLELRA